MGIYYVTLYDTFSGVYRSQVIDVVKLYQKNNIDMKLIAFLSIRHYKEHSQKIKQVLPDAIVLPSFPKQKNWKMNKWLLKFVIDKDENIALVRGPTAVNLCLELRDRFFKIIYDGRGASFAEYEEYRVDKSPEGEKRIKVMERKAVIQSDYRIAVSNKLVGYWQQMYGYKGGHETVIPCSLSDSHEKENNTQVFTLLPGLKSEDILLIFSGSAFGWHSFETLSESLELFLTSDERVKILFLSQEQTVIKQLMEKYPDRIYRKWVNPDEVNDYLQLGDYGLLIREESVTNSVASPVKFAEYLMAGLNVIISPNIGDYSEFVKEHTCGFIMNDKETTYFAKTLETQKTHNKDLAKKYFSKSSELIKDKYLTVIRST